MDRQAIEKAGKQLKSSLPLIGARIRRSACTRLAEDSGPRAVVHLARALHSFDSEVARIAETALRSLKNQVAIDALCEVWSDGRDARLGEIVASCGYVAAEPVKVRVLSALKVGRLDATDSPEYLAELMAARTDKDRVIAQNAETALRSLKNQAAIDALCEVWADGRDARLGEIVASCGYVAAEPVKVRVLSALKVGRLDATDSPEHLAELMAARTDEDPIIAQNAETALRSLKNRDAIDALCEIVISDPVAPVARVAVDCGYEHSDVSRRCVFFLLTGQIERYLDLDFEFQHLRAEYDAADEPLRRRIAEFVRQSGDSRLLGLFGARERTGAIDKQARELNERDAAVVLDVYARNKRWAEIYSMLFHIPLSSVVSALGVLEQSGWKPDNEHDAALLDELIRARKDVGEIPAAAPEPEVALGPVLGKWIHAGREGEAARLHTDELRKRLRGAPPPEAVAALSALSARASVTTEDIEAARTHRHWAVRLACLALCEIAPEFAFSDAPTGGDGGGMWIDRLAPAILDSAIYRRRAISLGLEQVESLQSALAGPGGKNKQRAACGRILCALAAHRPRHTIEIDEEMVVRVSETEIEIEE